MSITKQTNLTVTNCSKDNNGQYSVSLLIGDWEINSGAFYGTFDAYNNETDEFKNFNSLDAAIYFCLNN